jgi:hypothetical protein
LYPVPTVQLISTVTAVLFPFVKEKWFMDVPVNVELPGYESGQLCVLKDRTGKILY